LQIPLYGYCRQRRDTLESFKKLSSLVQADVTDAGSATVERQVSQPLAPRMQFVLWC